MRKSKSKRSNNSAQPNDFNNKDNLQSDHEEIKKTYRNKKMREAGRRALKNGQTLEKMVTLLGFVESQKDEPHFELIRNYDAMQKSYGRGGNLGAHTIGPSSCDFSFWCNINKFEFISGGMLEAKSRESASINKSCLSEHQKEQLIRMEKMGHLGLILVKIVTHETLFYLVPIQHWYRGLKKSHNEEDLNALGYKLAMVRLHDELTNAYVEVPDILSVLKEIDKNDGLYKSIPSKYEENHDNRKLKNSIYSTIDRDFSTLDVDVDDEDY